MAEAVTCMVQKVCDHVKMEVSMKNYAQIEVFNAWHVKSYTGSFTKESAKTLETALKEDDFSLSSESNYSIFLEFSSIHSEYVAYLLNAK